MVPNSTGGDCAPSVLSGGSRVDACGVAGGADNPYDAAPNRVCGGLSRSRRNDEDVDDDARGIPA